MKEMSQDPPLDKTRDRQISSLKQVKSPIIPAGQKTTLRKRGGISTALQDVKDRSLPNQATEPASETAERRDPTKRNLISEEPSNSIFRKKQLYYAEPKFSNTSSVQAKSSIRDRDGLNRTVQPIALEFSHRYSK